MKKGDVVYYAHNPEYKGVVTQPGDEVSEVRWNATGIRQFINNAVVEVQPKEPIQCRPLTKR